MTTQNIVEKQFAPTEDYVCSEGEGGMVSTAHPGATKAGILMLERGGNAVDAAVAAAFALCVCESQACSLGGQTYGLLQMEGKTFCFDGSGRVPQHQERIGLTKEDILYGYKGTSVPTTPAVLAYMHQRFGRLTWVDVIEPAIELACSGFPISQLQHDLQKRELAHFLKLPGRSGAKYFLKNGKEPYGVGDLFIQPDLASLLQRLAENGVEEFYHGETGHRIIEDMGQNCGFLNREDLQAIPWPQERRPIEQRVFGHRLVTVPPPTQGRLLLYILLVAERVAKKGINILASDSIGLLADIFHNAYRVRMARSLNPDFYEFSKDEQFFGGCLDRDVELLFASNRDSTDLPDLVGGETTHLSVMDSQGNCVGITQSVNMVYGAKAAAEGLGFLYNNYLIDSWPLSETHVHGLVPGKTPPCSVAPFILMGNNDKPWLLGGSPGSQRIVTALSLFLLRVLYGEMSIDKAMRLPRFHCQEKGKVHVESGLFPNEDIQFLQKSGYRVVENPSFFFGAVHAVLKTSGTGRYQGVAEFRRDGIAAGVK